MSAHAHGTVTILATAALVAAIGLRASGTQSPPADVRSTQAGVYTDAQAQRGEQTFASNCVACHTTDTYTTSTFTNRWKGRPLSELFALITETMPEDLPGSLTPAEYAQVIAYLLKINRMPAGKEELPADAGQLKKIRFEIREP